LSNISTIQRLKVFSPWLINEHGRMELESCSLSVGNEFQWSFFKKKRKNKKVVIWPHFLLRHSAWSPRAVVHLPSMSASMVRQFPLRFKVENPFLAPIRPWPCLVHPKKQKVFKILRHIESYENLAAHAWSIKYRQK